MLSDELGQKEREYSELEEEWKAEKRRSPAPEHHAELDRPKSPWSRRAASASGSWMSELQYGKIPELEKQLARRYAGRRQEHEAVA